MTHNEFSLILLPTNKCNVDCEFCFDDKAADVMTHDQLSVIMEKLLDHMETRSLTTMTIHWQGGEPMLMEPAWFERALAITDSAAARRGKSIHHLLQSNMSAYTPTWNVLIREMFGNCVGTSMDYPNVYRKVNGHTADEYTRVWERNIRSARDAGIQVGVISIPNKRTLEIGAEKFYSYFVNHLGVTSFQINTSFSGAGDRRREESVLEIETLREFMLDLAAVWAERGLHSGIKLWPFDELLKRSSGESGYVPRIWPKNCSDEFVSIDAAGQIAQCDCWVTSSPEYRIGNIFEETNFTDLIDKSKAGRPAAPHSDEPCTICDYLSVCHGGCPVRTNAVTGVSSRKDPYSQMYKSILDYFEQYAVKPSAKRQTRSLRVHPIAPVVGRTPMAF